MMLTLDSADRWKKTRLAALFEENKKKNTELESVDALQFFFGNIVPKKRYELTEDLKAIYEKYTVVAPNDIMINGLNLNYDFVSQRIAQVKDEGIITSAYIALRPREGVNSRYYNYFFKAMDSCKLFHGMGTGIRLTLSFSDLKNMQLPVPPRDEQDRIVRFLDWKVSGINKLIAAKKKEIKLLEERKMALINATLTRGIKGSRQKQSQIDGLGMIPDGWSEKALKWYATSNDESIGSTTSPNYELDYIDISAVGFGKLKTRPVHMTFENAPLRARRIAREGDTILSTVRTYLKSVCYIDSEQNGCIVSTGFSVLRPREHVYPRLLGYALCCDYFIDSVIRNSVGTSYPAINDSKLMGLKLALPPTMKEQQELYNYIVESTSSTDKMIAFVSKEIHVLEELKTRLISDAVTGQIDVRDIEIPEYEHVEEDLDEDADGDVEDIDVEEKLNLSEIPTGSNRGFSTSRTGASILQLRYDYFPRLSREITDRHEFLKKISRN